MNATFDFVETGPASGAFVFAIGGPAGAGLAANRAIALVMQGIVRDFVVAKVFPDIFTAPIGHRVELDDVATGALVKRVHFEDADSGTGIGLPTAQARNPA